MKTINRLLFYSIFTLFIISCSENDTPLEVSLVAKKYINLYTPQNSDRTTNPPTDTGSFTKFDFDTGTITLSSTDWDIAFRGVTILVNGGEKSTLDSEPSRTGEARGYMVNGTFVAVTSVDRSLLKADSSEELAIPSGITNGWYSYNPVNHQITPTPGKVLVFKTTDGKYAKVEILSYYKDSDITSEPQYYTFNYIYQSKENTTDF